MRSVKLLLPLLILAISGCAPNSGAPISTTSSAPSQLAPSNGDSVMPAERPDAVFVPAGQFIMGDDNGLTDERPAHPVTLDAFWIDRTEVTNSMYAQCADAGACQTPASTVYYDDPAYSDHPVAFVSWVDAKNFCAWAGKRLPTEAEWEKAATWNSKTNIKSVYPWGNDFDCRKGNFDDEDQVDASLMPNTEIGCDGFVRTAPVGSFPDGASSYGALDMAGNVWEWVHDAFIEVDPFNSSIQNYYAISEPTNPQGVDPAITEYRSMRGGSWNFTFGFGRSAYRLWYGKDDVYDGVGFRCAQTP